MGLIQCRVNLVGQLKYKDQSAGGLFAAESKAVLKIRRYLSRDCGVEKKSLNWMGDWGRYLINVLTE